MLTIDWQPLSPRHGFVRPPAVDAAGLVGEFDAVMERSAALHDLLHDDSDQASYAVSLAYRVRYSMQFNAREAIHMLEPRTSPQGHEAYRRVCQRMHTAIAEVAGHRAVAEAMTFVDHSAELTLGRLDAQRRAEESVGAKRAPDHLTGLGGHPPSATKTRAVSPLPADPWHPSRSVWVP